MKLYLVTTIIEGERAYFMGLMPTDKGPSNAAWTTQRGLAVRFPYRQAAEDTAKAMRVGEVVDFL